MIVTMAAPQDYDNNLMLQKFVAVSLTELGDVNFVFEEKENLVIIPAQKKVLSASSPVFNAMFYGDLQEKNDVRIVDATSAAFKEFLQIFYYPRVSLTMDNVFGVLKLVDKYDVADGIPVCVDFLKNHLSDDNILWGLHLAVTFKIAELKKFCMDGIQKEFAKFWKMFEMSEDGIIKLVNYSGRKILEEDVEKLFPHIMLMSKNVIVNYSDGMFARQLRENRIFSLDFVKDEWKAEKINEREMITFRLNDESMLLTDIFCWNLANGVSRKFDITVEDLNNRKLVFTTSVTLTDSSNERIKLEQPIEIMKYSAYAIIMSTSTLGPTEIKAYKTIMPKQVFLAPNVEIRLGIFGEVYTRSLISHLCFMFK